jgi:peptidoglycan-associated lipoprotein
MVRCQRSRNVALVTITLVAVFAAGCAKKKPPVARPMPPAVASEAASPVAIPSPSPTPTPVRETPLLPSPPMAEDPMSAKSIDDLNRDSPFQPAFYSYDSAELTAEARAVLDADAAILKKYPSWTITIEGHCDERGTAEYNLALGERRAVAAQSYFVSLGIPANRLRTVSYGKEFPFDPGHDEAAWSRNRRAHIIITGK